MNNSFVTSINLFGREPNAIGFQKERTCRSLYQEDSQIRQIGISEYFRAETRCKVGLVEFLISYQEATELWEAKWEMDAEGGQASFMSVLSSRSLL